MKNLAREVTFELTVEEAAALKSILKLELTTALNHIVNDVANPPLTPTEKLVETMHNISMWNKLDRIFTFQLLKLLGNTDQEMKLSTKVAFPMGEIEHEAIIFILQKGTYAVTCEMANKKPGTAVPATVIISKHIARLREIFKVDAPVEVSKDFLFQQTPPPGTLLN